MKKLNYICRCVRFSTVKFLLPYFQLIFLDEVIVVMHTSTDIEANPLPISNNQVED